ncbi:hypothetical protein HYH03_017104 [Edaphochlamys debaryana]|uniref:Uncharacterized protein n=1 Tax=Edaphochlamys debaryana TaxID=47281 RepID=A0A835XNC1_9CHLO|nr:hypothetical protein HYH03_017104 [Edaphochlamys debaryana]|eukprot:KAG2484085.1 hypothetical protein HYH03_017104 [Edaphochlamys debaryana]
MERKYSSTRTKIVSETQPGLMDAVLSGECLGAVNTDLHTRYTLASDEKYCDLQVVGQSLSFGYYYAIPFRKLPAATNGTGGTGPSTTNPVVAALNLLAAEFIETGRATDAASKHFPTDNIALCTARADAERWATSKSKGGSDGLEPISIADVSGLFILLAAAAVISLFVALLATARERCRAVRTESGHTANDATGLGRDSPLAGSGSGVGMVWVSRSGADRAKAAAVRDMGAVSGASTPRGAAGVGEAFAEAGGPVSSGGGGCVEVSEVAVAM